MNGSGCEKCPVKSCDATYRGSRCAAQRSKYKLGDPQTNADRIRAMSDEELAAFLINFNSKKAVNAVNKQWITTSNIVGWLKQEVSE